MAINQKDKAVMTLRYAVADLMHKFSLGLIPPIVAVENKMVLAHMRTMLSELI